MIELSEYMNGIWKRQGCNTCRWCGESVYQDHDSGYWLHAAFGEVDGHNGLFCNAEEWLRPSPRKYVEPA